MKISRIIYLYCIICLSTLIGFAHNNENGTIEKLVDTYVEAFNRNDFSLLKSILSNNFTLEDDPSVISWCKVYAIFTIRDSSSNKISDLINTNFEFNTKGDICKVSFQKKFLSNDKQETVIICKKENGVWKLNKCMKGFVLPSEDIKNFTLTLEHPPGKKIYEYIEQVNILDISKLNLLSERNYTVYYEDVFLNIAPEALKLVITIDSMIRDRLGFRELVYQHIALTRRKGSFMVLSEEAIWPIPVMGNDILTILEDLTLYFAHEITEETLWEKYGMKGWDTRWYTDGVAEYASYTVTGILYPQVFKENYIDVSYRDYLKYKGEGNLLDWRGIEPTQKEIGEPISGKFIYGGDKGQYGRALQFFIDLVKDYGEDIFPKIHKQLENKKGIHSSKILSIMTKLTGEDIKKRIATY